MEIIKYIFPWFPVVIANLDGRNFRVYICASYDNDSINLISY